MYFGSEKSIIFAHLEALKFEFDEFLHFLKTENYQNHHIQSPKMAVLEVLDSQKLISRKIRMTEK